MLYKVALEKHDIFYGIKATLSNDTGEEYTTLNKEESVRKIRSANLGTLQRLRNKSMVEVEQVYDDIGKLYTFKILSGDVI